MKTLQAILIEKEIMTDGHSPLLIADESFDKYIIKNTRGHNPAIALINEWLCSELLRHWNIYTPETALINVPKELLIPGRFSLNHKHHYYDNPAFGSKHIEYAVELNEFIYGRDRLTYRSIENPADFLHIALFDTWIENDDRKPTNHNLLLVPSGGKFRIVAIDHAFVCSTLDYAHLDPASFHPISNEHILLSGLGHSIKRSSSIDNAFVQNEKEYFYLCIESCRDHYDEIMAEIITVYPLEGSKITQLKDFLFNDERNEKVFIEYLYRLNQ